MKIRHRESEGRARGTMTCRAAAAALLALAAAGCSEATDEPGPAPEPHAAARIAPPRRVVIVLFDQMVPDYADRFAMPNFRRIRDAGTSFDKARLGYMASETVISHDVIMSAQLPKHMA